MRYNAGSEVYTQGLCQALAKRHEVHVFTWQRFPHRCAWSTHLERPTGPIHQQRFA